MAHKEASNGAPQPARQAPQPPSGGKGQQIGEYSVVRTLGTGSFGKVKLATHTTGYKVAMKFISKRKIATPETQSRVTREIQYLTLLQHPHIIKLYDVLQTQESIVMVLEYLDTELFDYIVKTGKMAEDKARRFFQQIVAAVEYCHSNDIVHRDLKPENLLLDSNLNVKIADFGLSNVMRDGDFLRTSCGSPNYAAPEVITGKLYAGPEIDIWSCGVILFVLLCGRLPFDDDHIPALFKKIGKGDYHAPPYLSNDAKALIKRMLTVDPNARARLSEIRATPWFQQDLPAYLATPAPRQSQDDDEAGQETTETPQAEIPPPEGIEWVEGLGWVERAVVEDLSTKIPGTSVEQLLQDIRSGEDRSLRIAYQLCRDNRQPDHSTLDANGNPMPPPGVGAPQAGGAPPQRTPSVRRPRPKPAEADADVLPPPSAIRILPASLPRSTEADSPVNLKSRVSPLKTGRDLAALTPNPSQIGTSAKSWAPRKRSKWHFGIRSKSPPAEVMLEIYRTLAAVGFEWKRKDEDWNALLDTPPSPTDARKARKDEEERNKKLQDLFFIECRGIIDGMLVRMDLQLYTQDREDDSYLVDFRCIGYRRLKTSESVADTSSAVASEEQALSDTESRARAESSSTVAGDDKEKVRQAIYQRLPYGTIASPFLFFEMATRLISELAAPSSA